MPETQIVQQITYGGSPASPDGSVAAVPAQTVTVTVRGDQEYVAGRYPDAVQNYLRTLPPAIDDLTADFGDDMYERMLLDAHVAAEVSVLKASILETGLTFAPARPDETDDGHALSVEIRDAAERMFADLASPVDDVLWDMGSAIATGNRVAELTYRTDSTLTGRTRLLIDRMSVKPRRALAFVVDAYLHCPGFLAAIPGVAWTTYSGMVLGELAALPNFLPREKFAVWTHRPKDGDPRGTSILRPIHNAWWLKAQLWGEYLKYLTQFAGPSVIGFTAPDARDLPDPSDPTKRITAQQYMQRALAEIRNGGAASFAAGAAVQPLLVPGNGQSFLQAFALLNREMTKGILTQSLATEEGRHQARAAAQVHQDVLDTLVRQGKRSVVRMIRQDVLRPWVRYNWGPAALELVPEVTLGDTEEHDTPVKWTAMAALKTSGYLDDSQLAQLDQDAGLPPRDPDWLAKQQAQQAPALPPSGQPPTPIGQGKPGQQPQAVAA